MGRREEAEPVITFLPPVIRDRSWLDSLGFEDPRNKRPDAHGLKDVGCARDWNGTANVSLWRGRYTLAIVPTPQGSLTVTGTFRVLYPGDRNATDHAFFASGCGG